MVQSDATSVAEYLRTVDAARRPALKRLRELCREHLRGWEERMQWGMPGYGPSGADPVVSFNCQVRHIAFYAGPTAVARFKDRLKGVDTGKGCVRYRNPAAIDFDVVADMLKEIRARGGPMC
jgi:uncharacterized protein YdhG (YjbR/CyaY superfamily)